MLKMKRMLAGFAALTATAVLLTVIPQLSSLRADDDDESGAGFVGAWLGNALAPFPGSNPVPNVVLFNRDGTFIGNDMTDFGGAPFPGRNNAFIGSWVRTGKRSHAFKAVFLELGNTGVYSINLAQGTSELAAGDLNHLTTQLTVATYNCSPSLSFPGFSCPDVLTAPPAPSGPPLGPFTIRYTRIRP